MDQQKTIAELQARIAELEAELRELKSQSKPGAELPPITGTFSMTEPKDGFK